MAEINSESIRKQAARAREESQHQYKTSEYPGYGRSVHESHAGALDELANAVDEIGSEPPSGGDYAARRARRVWSLKMRAARKRVESAALSAQSHDMGSHRPMGQPLQGSPARRRAQANAMERERRKDQKASEAYHEADELERRAAAAESNRSISSDDPEALTRLREKLSALERRRDGIKAARNARPTRPILNYRAPDGFTVPRYRGSPDTMKLGQVEMTKAEWRRTPNDYKGTRVIAPGAHRIREKMDYQNGSLRGLVAVFLTDSKEHPRPSDETAPEKVTAPPAWELTNIGAQIRSVKERMERLEESAATPEAEGPLVELPGVTVEDWKERNRYALISNVKPPREITRALRGLGLRWMRSESAWVAWRNNNGRYSIEKGARLYSEWWEGRNNSARPAECRVQYREGGA